MAEKTNYIQELVTNARRTQILDAATTVFAQKGFHKATIKDVAQEAGVADGTIYTYFGGKNDVLIAILDRLNQTPQRPQHFETASELDFRAFFEGYLRERLNFLFPNATAFRAVLPELLANPDLRAIYQKQVLTPTFALAEQYFGKLAESGQIRSVNIELTVRTIAATTFGLLLTYLLDDEQTAHRWEELPGVVTDLLYNGLKVADS